MERDFFSLFGEVPQSQEPIFFLEKERIIIGFIFWGGFVMELLPLRK
jgi:hypothetical protein